jgi:hypothetical protein
MRGISRQKQCAGVFRIGACIDSILVSADGLTSEKSEIFNSARMVVDGQLKNQPFKKELGHTFAEICLRSMGNCAPLFNERKL